MRIDGARGEFPLQGGGPSTHVVQEGETLQSIADQHSISSDSLAKANFLSADSQISAGQELVIPTGNPGAQEPSAAICEHSVWQGEDAVEVAAQLNFNADVAMQGNFEWSGPGDEGPEEMKFKNSEVAMFDLPGESAATMTVAHDDEGPEESKFENFAAMKLLPQESETENVAAMKLLPQESETENVAAMKLLPQESEAENIAAMKLLPQKGDIPEE